MTRRYYQRRLPENPLQDYYFIIRDTDPAQSLLLEYGFIDNPNDQQKLQNDLLNYVEGVVRAVANYGGYNYIPPEGQEGEYYTVKKGDSLYSIAKQFGLTVQQLRDLNQLTTDVLQIGQTLRVKPLDTSPPSQEGQTYTVKSGDSLWSIARDFNITVQELKAANNLTSDILQIGQILVIPSNYQPPSITTQDYIVQRGDSLWTIAREFNTTVNELRSINNLTSDILQIGQILKVPSREEEPMPPATPSTYTVQRGDSLWSIAKTFGVSVDDIKTANNLTTNLLQIGQVLIIPTESNIPPVTPTIYTVQRGDSLWTIARKFGTTVNAIREANGLTSDLLSIGMTLKIPTDL